MNRCEFCGKFSKAYLCGKCTTCYGIPFGSCLARISEKKTSGYCAKCEKKFTRKEK